MGPVGGFQTPELTVSPAPWISATFNLHTTDLPLEPSADSPRASPWSVSLTKRCFDAAVSLLVLILFALPMLAIAILIRLSSRGPAIFVQKRVGRGGEAVFHLQISHHGIFPLHSVRSRPDPEWGQPHYAARPDSSQAQDRRASAVLQRPPRRHEPDRSTAQTTSICRYSQAAVSAGHNRCGYACLPQRRKGIAPRPSGSPG